jgi:electron transfer flavoprotein alpha subunit
MSNAWIIVTEEKQVAALAAMARGMNSGVTAVVVGSAELAAVAAAAGVDAVKWIEPGQDCPAEAYAGQVAALVAADNPKAVVSSASAAGRVIAGATAARLGASIVPRGLALSVDGHTAVVECEDLDGRVVETMVARGPVVTFYGGEDVERADSESVSIERVAAEKPASIRIEKTEQAAGADAGITKAAKVISIGRGLKKKEDIPLIQALADALGAELGCSMPVADDLGWIPQERYVGRSGQHITPDLYLAIGLQGAPQHLEGIKGTRIVVGINNDPDAPIFKAADYGILGDLYEVVPALRVALGN